ncbi:hypothetical protein HYV64_01145 [Candidatus Shapirobacteria bacterium]|nr:hypothetical protein [Candidatus Shapirobacteria bacterium]
MKNSLFSVFIFYFLFFTFVSSANAAKKRVYGSTAVVSTTSKSVVVSPRLRRDKGALLLNVSGLSTVKSLTYELTYTGSGQDQGVFGSIEPSTSGNSTSRSLYFGTCSHNVCNPHSGVKNARLTVTIKTSAGKNIIRRYRIKT